MAEAPTEWVIRLRAEFDPPIEEVRRLLLRPGETLVVKVADLLSADRAGDIRKYLQAIFGEEQKVLVLDGGVDLEVVRPTDAGGEHPGEIGTGL